MTQRVDWDTQFPILLKLREDGLTLTQCGHIIGCGKSAVARKLKPTAPQARTSHCWTEENLTERWVDYRARKQAERRSRHEHLSASAA